jgi:hypothetical protein
MALLQTVLTSILLAPGGGWVHAQPFPVAEGDLPKLKLNHYFTPDKKNHTADFEWTFTKTDFTIKKGTGPIPAHLIEKLLPEGVTGDTITGKWKLKDGKLELTEIRVGEKAGKKDVSLPIFKTAPTVVRICDPDQFVFGVAP